MQDNDLESVLRLVQERITPKAAERTKIQTLEKLLEERVSEAAESRGLKVLVRVEGSVAKDTWLSGEPDIDVFMRVPKDVSRDRLAKTCLEIARKATEGSMQIERFADHPYLEAFVDDVRVNVVPCYDVRRGDWLSATDRTPYHTDYVKKHLTGEMHSDVRLLKKFMKGVGVYGAEIKIGGFSGYLCELLVLNYGSFVSVLKAFAGHKQPVTVDIEGHFKGRENEFALLFPETLIVVDPIDKGRNVASAVQRDRLYSFVAAARQFLKEPAIEFFFPPRIKPMTANKLKERLEKSDSSIVFVTFRNTQSVPDILWGQLYKSQRSLRKLLALNDFVILRDLPWSDEKTLSFFVFELEQRCIPSVKKHLGPPIEREKECESFVEKHRNNASTVEGPFVEDGRWAVILRRRCVDAVELLKDRLRNGGKDAGVAEGLSGVIRDGFSVLVNADIIDIYNGNRDFSLFLTDFLSGKPKWLESHQSQDD